MLKNLDETVCHQSEKRQEWIRGRLQEITEDTSNAPRLPTSSAASFPGRNECPGTHCNLIEQQEKEDSSCQESEVREKMEERTERESGRSGSLAGAVEISAELAEWRRL